ncbi:MAG: 50S ribosomal protein L1 [Gammaproteobacteria bacterium]|nr:50S ribosomal protein L1 [Gammaproteobacteria bacterium]
MGALSKRTEACRARVEPGRLHELNEALSLLKACATVKFDESVDVAINLGIDPRKSDQTVRGASVLPRGTGKTVKVAVFADGDQAKEAKAAGADYVGMQDLADQILGGMSDFGVVIAAPSAMGVVGKLGKLLGPKGLMPNPKVGTVTKDVGVAVKNAKAGQVQFRADKNGIVHCAIGKISFPPEALTENLMALLHDLVKAKPPTAKGIFLKKISLSTTMGPGVLLDQGSLGI